MVEKELIGSEKMMRVKENFILYLDMYVFYFSYFFIFFCQLFPANPLTKQDLKPLLEEPGTSDSWLNCSVKSFFIFIYFPYVHLQIMHEYFQLICKKWPQYGWVDPLLLQENHKIGEHKENI